MKIVLTGVETNNKGAELMLYAILQEIEKKHPSAKVYVEVKTIPQGINYIKTNLDLRYWPFSRFLQLFHINGILSRIGLPLLKDVKAVKSDYYLDASGFLFSDQCKLWGTTPEYWKKMLSRQYRCKAKIVFLPQAFGPFNMESTQKAITVIGKYSSIIMAREKTSYNYIEKTGLVDMRKVKLYKDFTCLVEGVFPEKYDKLKNGICIIPNYNMMKQGLITCENYIKLLSEIIYESRKSGRPAFILNHEGKEDEELAYKCQKSVDADIEVVTGLNALEVKGLISSSYLVVSSRFHGVVSSLSSCVPCLATSWSHKYEELYKDYDVHKGVLPIDNLKESIALFNNLLNEDNNLKMRRHLEIQQGIHRKETQRMWEEVWK